MSKNKKSFSFNRRKFLQGAGATTVAAGLSAHATATSANARGKTPFDYDCLVIGGGFAGVTAARELKKNNYSCAILEARNRLGGRTFYAPFGDKNVELGGAWIHWTQPFVWAEAMRYELEIAETPGATADKIIKLENGKAFEPDMNQLYSNLFTGSQSFIEMARKVWPRPYDTEFSEQEILKLDKLNIEDLLKNADLTPAQHSLFKQLFSDLVNTHISKGSATEVLRILALCGYNIGSYYDVHTRYKFKEGTKALIDKIAEDGKPDIKLNTPVKRIEQKQNHVVVTTETGEILTAATVVSTIPLNVLKDVEFIPPLHPHKLAASKEGHPGKGFKVYAQVKGKTPNALLLGDNNEAMGGMFSYHIGDEHSLLVGFGNDRDQFDIYDDELMQQTLRKYVPDIEVTGTFGYDWIYDRYSQGTWCTWQPSWQEKYGEGLRDEPEGLVYFASSDFCEGTRGYIDGAIGSGIKAAQQISEYLG